ncbi:hypothetical protein PVAND_012634 [Polypedilum vanderplanki]|uniref:procollagen-proline 4-dioxygenase n=1 Tax=Polypedilum vanderplanki TaxID=319348 RepID=A0A9J6CN44_POLVA|nr:hypothetical protein PVAND_012634 [Polypedilum vanderplanki]
MEKLANDEAIILEEFEKFVNDLENEMNYLVRKLNIWIEEHKHAMKDIIKYITNPINSLLLIKRTTVDVDLIHSRLLSTFYRFKQKIAKLQPTTEDFSGAVDGLLRLQSIYKLQTSDIVNGVIDGEQVSEKMKSHDLLSIATHAMTLEKRNFFIDEYSRELKRSISENGDEFDEIDQQHLYHLELSNLNTTKINPYSMNDFPKNGIYSLEKEEILYSKMCRKEGLKSPKESAALKCRYLSISAFSKIAPYKIEEADHHSNLVIFHEIISDSEIEILKNISRQKLTRGEIYENDLQRAKTFKRVAKVAWLKDEESEVVSRISKRVEDMTGLSMKTAEDLQVQNYGIGGHYNPHWDMTLKRDGHKWTNGNRIATVLFYLSTVDKGGATVFPYLKVHVPAVKGTAAFWYNLRESGDDDYYTRHAACPVLIGSKWVANKWIHEHEQEFRRPCLVEKYIETSESETMSNVF